MDTIKKTAATVLGARHARIARNGQDAAVVWGGTREPAAVDLRPPREVASVDAGREVAVAVVCDGCSSGASSEVGARLGAKLFTGAVSTRLCAGASALDPATWEHARRDVVASLADLLERMLGGLPRAARLEAIRDYLLFTIVAAAMTRDGAAVWALGDGVYSFGDTTRELGPFRDNEPPYVGYDLLGQQHEAHFATASSDTVIIGTDGAAELHGGIERFAGARFLDHPDLLRRELALLARSVERIDWDERRVVRTPAVLQDDCAIAVLRREAP